jgi:hypothetical protein
MYYVIRKGPKRSSIQKIWHLPTTKNLLPFPKPSGCPDSCLDELYLISDSLLKGKINDTCSSNFLPDPSGTSSQPPSIQSVAVPAIGISAQLIDTAMLGPGVKISTEPRGFNSNSKSVVEKMREAVYQ